MKKIVNKKYKYALILFLFLVSSGIGVILSNNKNSQPPKNIILFIGDGMGFEHIKAAGMYYLGDENALIFSQFPHAGSISTYSADSAITDSAAAATAISTGVKVNNGVIAVMIPGDGRELPTVLEHYQSEGKSVGLITTTYVTHATPAAFGAHETNRNNYTNIADDYFQRLLPDVIFGGAKYVNATMASGAGYAVISNTQELLSLDTETSDKVSGQFSGNILPVSLAIEGSVPHLSDMLGVAINILDNNENGFILMVEGALIDYASHLNDERYMVNEIVDFSNSVEFAMNWASERDDTLILVTADHETGGLTVVSNNGMGNMPTIRWATTGHSAVNVPVYGWGVNSEQVTSVSDNAELFDILCGK